MPTIPTYTHQEICQMAGITYRQLDYWQRTGLLQASYLKRNSNGEWGSADGQRGSGSKRVFSNTDAVKALAAGWMLANGMTLPFVRSVIQRGNVVVMAEVPLPEVEP